MRNTGYSASNVQVPAISVLKGIAIILVIVTHSVGATLTRHFGGAFLLDQAVPVFVVITGVNAAQSRFSGFSVNYFWARAKRLAPQYIMTVTISMAVAAYFGVRWFTPWMIFGLLPTSGPGNYYITVLFQLVLVTPLAVWCFRRWSAITIAGLILGDLAFELLTPHTSLLAGDNYFYTANAGRYLAALGIGLWIRSGKKIPPIAGAVSVAFAAVYLAAASWWGYRFPLFDPSWQPLNVVAYPFAGLLVWAGLQTSAEHLRPLAWLGRHSYEIFLSQIIVFWVILHSG